MTHRQEKQRNRKTRRSPNDNSKRRNAETIEPSKYGLISGWGAGMILWIAIAVVVFVLTYRPVTDPDTWFHLEAGEWILQNDKLSTTDPFSYTAGDVPYVPSGWLTEILMARLDVLHPGSSLGPILMVTAVVGLAAVVVLLRAWRVGTLLSTGILLMIGLCTAVVRFSPRPDVWSILGLITMLFLLTTSWARRADTAAAHDPPPRQWPLWFLPPLIALWANLHAGVLVAVPFLLTYLAWLIWQYRKTREIAWIKPAIPVVLACAAWMLNPYGFGIVGLALRIASIPKVSWVMEWMPYFQEGFPMVWPVYAGTAILVGAAAWALWNHRRSFHPLEIIWLLMLLCMVLLQRRQISMFAVAAPLLLSRHLRPAELWLRSQAAWRGIVLSAAVAAGIVYLQISGANGNGGGKPRMGRNCGVLPCDTADFLAANPPPEPIFNSYNIGGYLLHALYPDTKVYIDGRLDTYPHQVWLDMLAVEESRLSIDELIKRYGIQTFVIGAQDSFGDPMHLASRLAQRKDFALVHLDDVTAVFVKRNPENIVYLEAFGLPSLSPWNLDQMRETLATGQKTQQVVDEMGHLLLRSGQSATAGALAAFIAWNVGDETMMNQQLASARQRQPHNRLLRIVRARMTGRN